ncbi:MAG: HAMP domain-containing protein [Gammaproteobacteria bacterium]|nr:HAMP domain-containing protein [Gammaproteobacteria bacterium]
MNHPFSYTRSMPAPRKRSLKNLLFIHEVAFLFLVAVTGLLSGLYTYFWQRTSTEAVRINNLIYLTEQIRGQLFRQIQDVIRARILEDTRAVQAYRDYSRNINRDFNQLRRNSESRDEDEAIQSLQVAYREIQNDMNKIFEDPYSINLVVRMRILDPRFAEHMVGRFETGYGELKALLSRKNDRLVRTRDRWTRFAPVLIPVIFLVALLIVLRTARVLRTGFVAPMATVKEGAAVISRGKLDHRIPVRGVREVAEIAESINLMARDLSASRDALVQSEKQAALGALIPVVAHNIRNPLASIRATVQVLDEVENKQELQESRAAIIETIDRLGRWVNALVSYLHPLKPDYRSVAASRLVETALAVLKPKLDEKALRVIRENWEADTDLQMDPDLMEQAVSALLANAIEASPPDGTLNIALAREDGRFLISIRDAGPGIPFEPAPGNLEPAPSTKRYGTGLGIPIAFKICRSHGWDLAFKAGSGAGTTVTISAPVSARRGRPA